MAAWRPFGPLNYPTWWVSEMWVDRAAPAVHYRHVRGITTGMDVVWRFEPDGGGTEVTIVHEWTGPRWPLIGGRPPIGSSGRSSSMASRRARWRASSDCGSPDGRNRGRHEPHDASSSPASGRSRRSGSAWRGCGTACAAGVGRSLHHALRPVGLQVADRRRGGRLRSDRSHRGAPGPPARPLSQFTIAAARMALGGRRARPRGRGPRPGRRHDGHRAGRRGARRGAATTTS